ncbi:hypothetical protein KCU71_g184, partial [Aureobasidium melanogenum]
LSQLERVAMFDRRGVNSLHILALGVRFDQCPGLVDLCSSARTADPLRHGLGHCGHPSRRVYTDDGMNRQVAKLRKAT